MAPSQLGRGPRAGAPSSSSTSASGGARTLGDLVADELDEQRDAAAKRAGGGLDRRGGQAVGLSKGRRRTFFAPAVRDERCGFRIVDEVQQADFVAIGRLFVVPKAEFLPLVANAYGVHPSAGSWRHRFFASLLEPPGDKVDYTY